MDKKCLKQRRNLPRKIPRGLGVWTQAVPENMTSENLENASHSEINAMELLQKHLEDVLQTHIARKEHAIDEIRKESSLVGPAIFKQKDDLADHYVPSKDSSFCSMSSPFENRSLERSDSSFLENQAIVLALQASVSSSRAPGKPSVPTRRVASETNESLRPPNLHRAQQNLRLQLSSLSSSSRSDFMSTRDCPNSQQLQEPISISPHILWSELTTVKELGSGQFASVKLVSWAGVYVALKEWHTLIDGESENMALEEAKTLAALLHPCVLTFYGIVVGGPSPGLVVEYLPHCSLKTQLEKMKGTEADNTKLKIAVALRAARGMEFLHGKKVIHFDLKCDNLLCDLRDMENPVVKVGDVGLSKHKINTFVSGNMRGTVPWMAPELFPSVHQGPMHGCSIIDMVNEKVDVYSFGVVLWEIWEMGAPPYPGVDSFQLVEGIIDGSLKPEHPKDCHLDWASIMDDCLERDSSERPDFKSVVSRLDWLSQKISSEET